jgi:hypothetical protein
MVDQRPFLFEALMQVDNNTFPFYLHFQVACDFLPPLVFMCFLSFERIIK